MMSALAATPRLQSLAVEPRAESRLDSLLLYGTCGLLLFGPLAFGAVEPWSIFILQVAAAVLFMFWTGSRLKSKGVVIRGNALFAPMAAFAALIVLQLTARTTSYGYATVSAAMLFGCYGILCFLLVQCLSRVRQIKVLAVALSLFGLVLAVEALFQSISAHGRIYWVRTPGAGWVYGPYVNHNHYAGLMEMLLPVPLVLSLTRLANPRRRMFAASAAVIMAATIFLSGSRGGMLAFGVQAAIVAALALRQKLSRRTTIAAGMALVILVALLAWLGGGVLTSRLASIRTEARQEITGGIRLNIDRDAIKMFTNKPALGWGLGTFPEVYPQFRTFYTNLFVNQAHNDYLQLLVETGALGFVIMIWFLAEVFRRALARIKNWQADMDGAVALAALLGVCGILVHSFLDFNLEIPGNAALFYALCTIAAMEPRFRMSRTPRVRRVETLSDLPSV